MLLGYGSYLLYGGTAHAKEIIRLYQKSPYETFKREKAKPINDDKAG